MRRCPKGSRRSRSKQYEGYCVTQTSKRVSVKKKCPKNFRRSNKHPQMCIGSRIVQRSNRQIKNGMQIANAISTDANAISYDDELARVLRRRNIEDSEPVTTSKDTQRFVANLRPLRQKPQTSGFLKNMKLGSPIAKSSNISPYRATPTNYARPSSIAQSVKLSPQLTEQEQQIKQILDILDFQKKRSYAAPTSYARPSSIRQSVENSLQLTEEEQQIKEILDILNLQKERATLNDLQEEEELFDYAQTSPTNPIKRLSNRARFPTNLHNVYKPF